MPALVRQVKCVLRHIDDQRLEFELIFDDGCIKPIHLDSYAIRAFRGAGVRNIAEYCAQNYYDNLGENVVLQLIFV